MIVEDHLKNILSKQENKVNFSFLKQKKNFKSWKTPFAPKNAHSAFGDFPKEYLPKQKLSLTHMSPIHELT